MPSRLNALLTMPPAKPAPLTSAPLLLPTVSSALFSAAHWLIIFEIFSVPVGLEKIRLANCTILSSVIFAEISIFWFKPGNKGV